MKKFVLSLISCLLPICIFAEEKAEKPWQYVNATDLRLINKGWNDTPDPYKRLPVWLEDSVRPNLWNRAQCSTGIGVRFATDSKRIGVKYRLTWNTHMIHMADTGLKGTDLYIFEGDSTWRHVNTNRPYVNNKEDKICEFTYV